MNDLDSRRVAAEKYGEETFPGELSDKYVHERDWVQEAFLAGCEYEADTQKEEVQRYKSALEKIANEDFRGNRPQSAVIAYKALKGKE
jgi:hypothetical protein